MTTFDLRKTILPFSLLEISNFFIQMKPGDTMDIRVSDSAVTEELSSVLPRSAYKMKVHPPHGGSGGYYRIQITKTATTRRSKGELSCLKPI
jgi:TusA-related sulfurtransferase